MVKYFLSLLIITLIPLCGDTPPKKTVCLNMIVKNEKLVIERCLSSVKPLIDYWVIVDTGSTDGTQEIIKNCLKDIPGELHERPWVNFGHNRQEALVFAKGKGDYLLFMDADEEMTIPEGFIMPPLNKDYYLISLYQDNLLQLHASFINNHLNWKWQGVMHEEISCSDAVFGETIPGLVNSGDSKKGNRTQDPQKFLKDAKILEQELLKDPNNPRNLFYLAQCYLGAEQLELALKTYEKRANLLEGWDAEIFWSFYKMGQIQEYLKMPEETFIKSYSKAFESRPFRAEPLVKLATHFFSKELYSISYALAKHASSIPFPKDELMYIDDAIYDYEALFILASAALALGKYDEGLPLYKELLKKTTLSTKHRALIESNLRVIEARIPKSLLLDHSPLL